MHYVRSECHWVPIFIGMTALTQHVEKGDNRTVQMPARSGHPDERQDPIKIWEHSAKALLQLSKCGI